MNQDDFTQFRSEPSQEFAEAVYERISTQPNPKASLRSVLDAPVRAWKVVLLTSIAVVVAGACATQVLTPRQTQVGDFWVYEMSEDFICHGNVVYPSYTPSSPLPTRQPSPDLTTRVSLAEALDGYEELLGINLKVPTWAPGGFGLRDEYPEARPFVRYSINWLNNATGSGIAMMFQPGDDWPTGREIRVLRGQWEQVSVKGQPAVIVHGRCSVLHGRELAFEWNEEVTWLFWKDDGVFYELWGMGAEPETLVAMAESAE